MNDGIEKAVRSLKYIFDNPNEMVSVIEGIDFNKSFPADYAKILKDCIAPSKADSPKPTKAFGAFIGYKVETDTSDCESPAEYQKAIEEQMQKDILSRVPLLEDLLRKYGLFGHSIYLYFLPFNDAENDKKTILDELTK